MARITLGLASELRLGNTTRPHSSKSYLKPAAFARTLRHLKSSAPMPVAYGPAQTRPSEVPRAVSDASRAVHLLAWRPRVAWERILSDTLAHWRDAVAVDGQS